MKSKEQVLNDIMHDYNTTLRAWLKSRMNGVWENGYLHGRDDAFAQIFSIDQQQDGAEQEG